MVSSGHKTAMSDTSQQQQLPALKLHKTELAISQSWSRKSSSDTTYPAELLATDRFCRRDSHRFQLSTYWWVHQAPMDSLKLNGSSYKSMGHNPKEWDCDGPTPSDTPSLTRPRLLILPLTSSPNSPAWQQLRVIEWRSAHLDDKIWSTNGYVFLSKAAEAGVRVWCHGCDSDEAVLGWVLLKIGEGQVGGYFQHCNIQQASQYKAWSACTPESNHSSTHDRVLRVSLRSEWCCIPYGYPTLIQDPCPMPISANAPRTASLGS